MDRRLTPASDRFAHVSLEGWIDGRVFTVGEPWRIAVPLADLTSTPGGARTRQLWLGEGFTVIDRADGQAFGFADKDGYCGWLPDAALADDPPPTHWIATPGTHIYPEPRVQSREIAALTMGSQVSVLGTSGSFTHIPQGYVPTSHLLPLGQWHLDPVTVAEMFLHTPYLWGGNGRAGLDCSGLIQVCHHACGIKVPGDADLQEDVGRAASGEYQRGDLLFWKGHVAMVVDAMRLIHANGHSMSVAYEGIYECIARIKEAEGQGLRAHRRL
ncbi:NLP/P60 hydrolase [bacterium]|nr:NLP/P60 hydrolase [bacterium]